METVDYYGEFGEIVHLLVHLDRVREYRLDADVHWILPNDTLPGVTAAYGFPVVRADVPEPMIGLRPPA